MSINMSYLFNVDVNLLDFICVLVVSAVVDAVVMKAFASFFHSFPLMQNDVVLQIKARPEILYEIW